MDKQFYLYKAKVVKIIDEDTFEAEVNLGFNIITKIRFRLFGIDEPEIKNKDQYENTLKIKRYLENNILGGRYTIISHKGDKYGKWLATIYFQDGTTLNDKLIEEGLVKNYGNRN